ncbi:uncharacterized protein LOC142526079 [Primulina tabacum]|uniref:uncharacterized protein LOC142526079 n=1 Tax=Primulina tabacum TaxID=48773 RepID=UPI003F5A4DC4
MSNNLVFFIESDESLRSSLFKQINNVWKPPHLFQFRLDVDAGYDSENQHFNVASIIRNSLGQVCGAKALLIRDLSWVLAAELLALHCGMKFCLAIGISNVCIFSYSSEAVRLALNPDEEFGPAGVIALDVNFLLLDISFISIKHIYRSANCVAHFLARITLDVSLNFQWPS